MAALEKNAGRTRVGEGRRFRDPVKGEGRIFAGALVALDATGFAIPAIPTAARMRGVALHEADNRLGADGDSFVDVDRGPFLVANNGSIDRTHIGADVYVVDDNTVGAAGTLVAGKCLDVTPVGVTVEIL